MSDDLLVSPTSVPPPPPLLVVDLHDGHQPVFRLLGEMDLSNSGMLPAAVAAHRQPRHAAVVDLSGLTFCDATGITALLTVQEGCERERCAVSFRGARPQVRRLLQLTGVDRRLTLDPPV